MKYIKTFETTAQYESFTGSSEYITPNVSLTEDNMGVHYNPYVHDYSKDYLTFKITSDGNIIWGADDTAYTCTIEYSKNGGEWTSITSNTWESAPSISVVSGDTVRFRGDNATYCSEYVGNSFSNTTCGFNVEGNIMSLIDSTNFATATTLASSYTFYNLFFNCLFGLTDASNLVLPATTLAESCYESMFAGCSTLTTAPELPATTLANYCYGSMFNGCRNLNYIKCLATNISASSCTTNWVKGVASAGTFVKNSSMSSWTTGNNGIPTNWTVQDA